MASTIQLASGRRVNLDTIPDYIISMNIGLFGGTFDPVHRGHLALARAALERCKLHRICFVAGERSSAQTAPAAPHFVHRFAMLALATADGEGFRAFAAGGAQEEAAAAKDRKNRTTRSTPCAG